LASKFDENHFKKMQLVLSAGNEYDDLDINQTIVD
jgi:hypothetical protein